MWQLKLICSVKTEILLNIAPSLVHIRSEASLEFVSSPAVKLENDYFMMRANQEFNLDALRIVSLKLLLKLMGFFFCCFFATTALTLNVTSHPNSIFRRSSL